MVFLDPSELAVASAMMLAGSTVLSTVGFGIGMTSTPVLLLVLEPQTVVVMINTVSLALFVLIMFQTRRYLPAREMVPASVAGLLGVPVGVFILSSASTGVLRVSITAVIILLAIGVAFNLRGPIPRSRLMGPPVGFVVGVLLAATGIGGPLMALLLLARDWPRHAVRASLSLYFLSVEGTAVIGYGLTGMFTPERVSLILIVTIPVLLGFGFGTVLVRRMNERLFRHAVVAVVIVTSLMVLGREAFQL